MPPTTPAALSSSVSSSPPSDVPPLTPCAPVFLIKPFYPSLTFDSRILTVSGLRKRDDPSKFVSTFKHSITKVALKCVDLYLDNFDLDSDHALRNRLTEFLITSPNASENLRHCVSLATWDAPDFKLTLDFLQARIHNMDSSLSIQPSLGVLVVFSGQARRILRSALGSHADSPPFLSGSARLSHPLPTISEDVVPSPAPPSLMVSDLSLFADSIAAAVDAAVTRAMQAAASSPAAPSRMMNPSLSPAFRRAMGIPSLAPLASPTPTSSSTPVASISPRPGGTPTSAYGNLRLQPYSIPAPCSLPLYHLPGSAPVPAPASAPTPASAPASPSAPPADPTPPSDPSWDSVQCTGFSYPLGLGPLLAHRSSTTPPSPRQGTTWHYYQCDVHDPLDMVVDATSSTIVPWFAPRPNHGMLLHYPVRTSIIHLDKDLFLANMSNRGFDTKNQKHFQQNFPSFTADSLLDFPAWWNRVVQHTQNYGGFIPPLHTLRHNCPLGLWFDLLPLHIQAEVQTTFADLLASCLKSKSSGLTGSHAFLARLIRDNSNGYWILYALAHHAGAHPLLHQFPDLPHEPHQKSDMCLSDYTSAWVRYLHYSTLSGQFLSDRYFYQQFIRFLDPVLRSLLESRLDLDLRDFPLGTPLPLDFDPEHLLRRLGDHASYLGRPEIMLRPPRDFVSPTTSVHSLSSSPSSFLSDDLLLAALAAGSTRTCFLCGAVDHLVADCPQFIKLQRDPTSRRLLSRLLQLSSRPSSSSSSSRSSASVRQLAMGNPGSSAGEGLVDGEGLGAGEGDNSDVASADGPDVSYPSDNESAEPAPSSPLDFQ